MQVVSPCIPDHAVDRGGAQAESDWRGDFKVQGPVISLGLMFSGVVRENRKASPRKEFQ